MAKHTPDWELWVSDDQQFVSVGPVSGGCAVAEVVISDSAGIIREETLAAGIRNGRLMAAAPELAEALKGMVTALTNANGIAYAAHVEVAMAQAALRNAGIE